MGESTDPGDPERHAPATRDVAARNGGAPAVRLEGVTKRFPGVVANDDVDFSVDRGTIHALIGENGAGKTTLMNVLYGLYEPTEGTIRIGGEPMSFEDPGDAMDAGIGMIHQHFMLVDTMTVAENVVLGNEPTRFGGLLTDERTAVEETRRLAERYGFDIDPTERIEEISVGEQQRVEILKTLYRGAEILILDEPTAVLTPQEVDALYEILTELIDQGKTIIFITHKLGEALHAADEISVLRDGKLVGTVPAAEATREDLARMMVGKDVLLEIEKPAADRGSTVLQVSDMVVDDDRGIPAVEGVSFDVHAGEIFGIAGVDGNGQSELIEAITGLRSPESGTVAFEGADMTDLPRRKRIEAGMAYVAEDRQKRSLVMAYDLRRNGVLGCQRLPTFGEGLWIDWDRIDGYVDTVIEEYDVRPPDPGATAHSLSGGNQQKFIVGREFERDPSLVIAAQPTRGVDIGSIEFIHERLLELRSDGKATLLVSSKLDEVTQLSDRLGVIHDGQLVAVVRPEDVTDEDLGLLMAGERPTGLDVESARVRTEP
ncbi:ABC transporter ATP-binding protein [Halorubrum vacuolatum]|uniref:Nucleoside ABC transporter ATP-binding protein n=1 Tax=Halorubrum vacuolatum TaxID=63740 RepID=A0A238VLN4_HALVU|nr:ABC transporter ATP-binding protein [Halorubrum vacuolatum]SNR35108.1 nucleoside ABC transporter ATP-binding protein [Halorubrum vacuolatum]